MLDVTLQTQIPESRSTSSSLNSYSSYKPDLAKSSTTLRYNANNKLIWIQNVGQDHS